MDMYQSHSWRLISAGNVEQNVIDEVESLKKRLSPSETRVGWTYEYAAVDATIIQENVATN